MKRGKKQSTLAQLNQQQLAWLIYISEGYIANLIHALAVNSFTLDSDNLHEIDKLIGKVALAVSEFRNTIKVIDK